MRFVFFFSLAQRGKDVRHTRVASGVEADEAAALLTTSSTHVAAHCSHKRWPHVMCACSLAATLRWHAVHSALPPLPPLPLAALAAPVALLRASRLACRFARRLLAAAPIFGLEETSNKKERNKETKKDTKFRVFRFRPQSRLTTSATATSAPRTIQPPPF